MADRPLRMLLIEDHLQIAANIADYMENKGHIMDFAYNGEQGLDAAMKGTFDVIILDLNLPRMDGLEVCSRIRQGVNYQVAVIMLTARDSIKDKVSGFSQGADDYLTKPFSLEELEVRCVALVRRQQPVSALVQLGPLRIDKQRQLAYRQDQQLNLSTMGFKILCHLIEMHPHVVSRSELINVLWGDEPTESDAVRSHIYQLRCALDRPFAYPLLKTKHGVGFALDLAS